MCFKGKVKGAGIEVGRFLLNTTVGVCGVPGFGQGDRSRHAR